MKELPILFNAPMVRAILAGAKTQTRRALTDQPPVAPSIAKYQVGKGLKYKSSLPFKMVATWDVEGELASCVCPYGVPGNRLWVREAFCTCYDGQEAYEIIYTADNKRRGFSTASAATDDQLDWLERSMTTHGERGRPGIHMPRWASRITLEITDVCVERLQDISETDAKAEGLTITAADSHAPTVNVGSKLRSKYRDLWESINGPGSWDANPWVWVIKFRVMGNP